MTLASGDPDMVNASKWPWGRSLAMTESGETVQVDEILFSAVRDHCLHNGIRKGSVITCEGHDDEAVDVTLPSGKAARFPRHLAWFISVDRI